MEAHDKRSNEDMFYADKFGERIMREDQMDETGDTLVPDEATEDEMTPAESAYEDDFHESLAGTDQIGDERLMSEAERDYADSPPAAASSTESGHQGLGDKIREKADEVMGKDHLKSP